MSDLIKISVYLRKDLRKLLENVSFLLNGQSAERVTKGNIVNEALEIHLNKLIKDNNLKEKLKALEK